ncbi:MAG TPA: helix-turn-helix domain-containing protein [Rubrobacter sp.]|nr:helix-turn-helix domain-containing protein [Rubrobacter sp.]
MPQGPENHDVYEAARILGLSPARVRQMLRSGELEGERVEERAEGVPGPWRVRASSVRALLQSQKDTRRGERRDVEEAAETVALAPGEELSWEDAGAPGSDTGGTPSEAAEMLSESVRGLVEKLEALRGELEQLEGRLEFSEIQEFSLKESLARARESADRERARADRLQAELDAERRDRRGGERRGSRRSSFGG